jgi:hypothetical protein
LGDKVKLTQELLTIERNGGQEKTPGLPNGNRRRPQSLRNCSTRGEAAAYGSFLPTYLPTYRLTLVRLPPPSPLLYKVIEIGR